MNAPARLFSGAAPPGVVASEEVAVYRRREKLEKVAAYVPESVRAQMAALTRAWTILDRLEDKKAPEWSESESARRLIEASIEPALAELGIDSLPKTEADWARVEATLTRKHGQK